MTHRINALISDELKERIECEEESLTKVVNAALTFYLYNKNELETCKNELKMTQTELEKLTQIQNTLRESNQILIKDLEEARKREEDLKKLHTEYMLQMQQQISAKDSQLEKQAVHIQSLIQENSKLNVKLLPENTKKAWWKFW